jgi:hypothetical protein
MLPDLFLHSDNTRPPLRIGLLLDGFTLPRCFEQVIDHIQRCDFANIELLIIHRAPHPAPPSARSKWRTLLGMLTDKNKRKLLGYTLYQKLDKRFFAQDNDPLEEVDVSARLEGIDRISVVPIVEGFVHRFSPEDIQAIRQRDLDVLIRFGFNILRGEVLAAARYGIWSYHHGDNDFYRGGPPQFWELYEKNPVSGAILQVLTEELDAGYVLAKAIFSTAEGISNRRNCFTPFWGAVSMMIQKLYELHTQGWDFLERRAVPRAPYQGKRKIYRAPTNAEIARWLIPASSGIAFRRLKRVFKGAQVWNWRIAFRRGHASFLDGTSGIDHSSFEWQMPPDGHFHADPFLIEAGGRKWLFFEDYVYAKSKAVIACREVMPGGALSGIRTVLNLGHHLSFPFVFEHDGRFYMIPESADNNNIELYYATDFPYQWTLQKVLFRGKAVDTVVFFHEGAFWFFTTLIAPAGQGICLCIFYSDRLDGEWQPHPYNPISMDSRHARAAGRIFRHNGKLFRLAQDCTGLYGKSFSFREIVALTRTDYAEVSVKTVLPPQPYEGAHAYDFCEGLEVIDGLIRAPARQYLIPADFAPEAAADQGSRFAADRFA